MNSNFYKKVDECFVESCYNLVEVHDNFDKEIESVMCVECFAAIQQMERSMGIKDTMH